MAYLYVVNIIYLYVVTQCKHLRLILSILVSILYNIYSGVSIDLCIGEQDQVQIYSSPSSQFLLFFFSPNMVS